MYILDALLPRSARRVRAIALILAVCASGAPALAQEELAVQLAELTSLGDKVRDPDTRTRVAAFHRVWTIAMASDSPAVKGLSLDLIKEPVGSSSDHIRMPAVYAVAEIANSTRDLQVKLKALTTLHEPMVAEQLPIRIAAIDAVNSIVRSAKQSEVVLSALTLLGEPVRSANNGVRIPAINAILKTVEQSNNERAYSQALDLLVKPLDSEAAIGGMEVRMMAVVALERIGVDATETATKAKAMGLLQKYANKSGWEPQAKSHALEASARVQYSIEIRKKKPSKTTSS